MPIVKPFKRTARLHKAGSYTRDGHWQYVLHPAFASDPDQFVRSYLVIEKDFRDLLEFIEPADTNLCCFSIRIHALLLRACVEFEANCRAILIENNYRKARPRDWNITNYADLEATHGLSHFEVKLPSWRGGSSIRKPFLPWRSSGKLAWYQAYNHSKHSRHAAFAEASFEHLVDALCALQALLAAQFIDNDFSGSFSLGASIDDPRHAGFELGIGGFFSVKFPTHWKPSDIYDFDWRTLKNDPNPIQTLW